MRPGEARAGDASSGETHSGVSHSGGAFNLAGAGAITTREFAALAYEMAGQPLRLNVAPPWLVRILGGFSPLMRELAEMSYLQTDPVLLDDTKLRALLGTVVKTPYKEGVARTVAHLRERLLGRGKS
jgi:nucleoside-diphosphate-sugar epimerase